MDSSCVQPYTSRPKCRKREQHFPAALNRSVPCTVPLLTELTGVLRHYVETLRVAVCSVGQEVWTEVRLELRRSSRNSHLIQNSVKDFYAEFYKNPTSSSVADMLRTDGRTWCPHKAF